MQNESEKVGQGRILLVDDEEILVLMGSRILQKIGYEVVVASKGEDAVDIVRDQGDEIDLVVLDYVMPGIDGGETFKRIRALYPDMPVLIASGYSFDGKIQDLLSQGGCGFIQKPYGLKSLSSNISSLLNN